MFPVSKRVSCLGTILVSAVSSGCISLPAVYGETWAAPVALEGGQCPVIDGDYQNAGERFTLGTYEKQAISLAYTLGNYAEQRDDVPAHLTFENPAADAYETVSLQLSAGRLHVVAARADGTRRSFDLPTEKRCHDSAVILKPAWDNGTVLVASMATRSKLALGRAEDGSLLLLSSDAAMGFLFYMPIVAGSGKEWTLFPPALPAIEGSTPASEVATAASTQTAVVTP